ncbi:MAG: hypothetical protein JSW59_14160 [Phycisphaerales bacterium]|nr:MAG: hypothetical protein JSW59_14160 [Phycisphaerales bacterium]
MRSETRDISILDCTLRDGSYLIDYQFTAEDTYIVSLGLQRAGFRFIEIGHGTGLGSCAAGKGRAAATDDEYLRAAKSALEGSKAKFGMFFIPGIGKMEDLETAAAYGMGFVRIGTDVVEVEQAKSYIEKAKSLGMIVSSNLMKSYVVSTDEFVRLAEMAGRFGADVIVVVDSAGGMFPSDVREYVIRLRDVTDKQIGFHGHNNLQLAIANTLEAIRSGATIVDASLQGMGRSAGNTQTEILIMVLEKLGYRTHVDPYKAMDLGERVIKPMMSRQQGVDHTSIVSGIAQFHSSFFQIIDEAARKFDVDPRLLIAEVSEVDRIHVSRELAEASALRIKKRRKDQASDHVRISIGAGIMEEEGPPDPMDQAHLIADEITSLSKKTGKESVFSLTLSKTGYTSFPFVRQSPSLVIGNVEASDLEEAFRQVEILDGTVDWLLLDESCSQLRESGLEKRIYKSKCSWYSEDRVLRLGICALLSQRRPKGKVLLLSDRENGDLLKLSLKQQGVLVVIPHEVEGGIGGVFESVSEDPACGTEKPGSVAAIVSLGAQYAKDLSEKYVSLLSEDTIIYAARPNAFLPSFWQAAIARGQPICRVDSRAALAAELGLVIGTKKVIGTMGSATLSGVPVVSGGVIGRRGTVVVDSVDGPTRVIGVADGSGGLLRPEEEVPYGHAKEKVKEQLIRKLYGGEY